MMRTIYYDLTELFVYNAGRTKFYGISRVVDAIAAELTRTHPEVRFVVFSSGHQAFFEVPYADLPLPVAAKPLRMRTNFPDRKPLRDAIAPFVLAAGRALSRRRWRRAGLRYAPVSMDGGALVTAAHVKLIPEYLAALKRRGADVAVFPILHDVMPMTVTPDWQQASWRVKFWRDNQAILAGAPRLMTVSDFTADEIRRLAAAGLLPQPERIVPVPLVHECPPGDTPPEQRPPAEPYLLAVGQRVGRKNLECTFDALRYLAETGRPVPLLVLAGKVMKGTTDWLARPEYDGIRDRVLNYPDVSQTDLGTLYAGAIATVMATRMEGWGLPAGESLWMGTPALCADIPVLHDVCGDLALYFDPDSPQQLAAHVARLMGDPDHAAALRQRIAGARDGLRRWSDVAQDLVTAVRKLEAP
ncbi:glycosyltransferase [Pseudooceanicola sp. CBS1P-1]|uniref:Glycosyltransferase n=1 Tax=Pseudooceanicola albus TaxID=2692189 RepID=A0A6L7GCB8_9RHOB|nr:MULTISPECIES: glycosyltransferase [Pseudooceanicola]MBT9386672.1 glycosyltransferase [Pseudooceanicola endophyticus]MXN20916.1 glycosyltransferase [Pseudooceanicola albus]